MASVQNVAARILLYLRGGKELYDIRRGSLMNIYAEIVDTLKHIEEWVNWCVSKGPPLKRRVLNGYRSETRHSEGLPFGANSDRLE